MSLYHKIIDAYESLPTRRRRFSRGYSSGIAPLPFGIFFLSILSVIWVSLYIGYVSLSQMARPEITLEADTAQFLSVLFGAIIPLCIYGIVQLDVAWARPLLLGLVSCTTGYYIKQIYHMTPAGPGPGTQIALVAILLIYNTYLCWDLYRHKYCVAYYRRLAYPNIELPNYVYPGLPEFITKRYLYRFLVDNIDAFLLFFLVGFCIWTFVRVAR